MTDILQAAVAAKMELPATEKAVALLKQQAFDDWSNENDPVKRETIWHRVKVLNDILQMLVVAASEVDLAAHKSDLIEQGFQP